MILPAGATVAVRPEGGRRMGLARGRGPAQLVSDGASWVLIEGGQGRLTLGPETVDVCTRQDVFDGPGWSARLGPGDSLGIEGDLGWTVVWRPEPLAGERPGALIEPGAVGVEQRGTGPTERSVRTYVAEGSLICGETINAPGGWSSWPPHRHEHDEVYLYRFSAPDGFGVHLHDEEAAVVRDGSAEYIESGYHPVVAAPAAEMYYLWALAGRSPALTPEFDPRYA